MTSQRQIAANRRNARRSTGPRTPEGRRAVSLNALKHGLRSEFTVLPGESQADFDALFDEFVEDTQPCSARDLVAIRQAAQSEWRLCRIAALEGAMYRKALQSAQQPQIPHLTPANIDSILDSFPAPGARSASPEPPRDLIAGRLLAGDVNRFATLGRYEAVLMRQYRQAWADLDSRPEPAALRPNDAAEPNREGAGQTEPTTIDEPLANARGPEASMVSRYGNEPVVESKPGHDASEPETQPIPATPTGSRDTEPPSPVLAAVPSHSEPSPDQQPVPCDAQGCQTNPFPQPDITPFPFTPPPQPEPQHSIRAGDSREPASLDEAA